jgi:hypothetical protein
MGYSVCTPGLPDNADALSLPTLRIPLFHPSDALFSAASGVDMSIHSGYRVPEFPCLANRAFDLTAYSALRAFFIGNGFSRQEDILEIHYAASLNRTARTAQSFASSNFRRATVFSGLPGSDASISAANSPNGLLTF